MLVVIPRPPHIHHCTSEPYRFFGRQTELALLEGALAGGAPSVVALAGPGGQGKTAIVQHWLEQLLAARAQPDGVFLWSFYRGKDSDLCLREMLAYAEGLDQPPDVSASWCVEEPSIQAMIASVPRARNLSSDASPSPAAAPGATAFNHTERL